MRRGSNSIDRIELLSKQVEHAVWTFVVQTSGDLGYRRPSGASLTQQTDFQSSTLKVKNGGKLLWFVAASDWL